MKIPVKFQLRLTPEMKTAILCAAVWYAIWPAVFHSRPVPCTPPSAPLPSVTRLSGREETLSRLQNPALFSLPSPDGFSGDFFKNRIGMRLSFEKPAHPALYLEQRSTATRLPDGQHLPEPALPEPGSGKSAVNPAPQSVYLFFSPELQFRAAETSLPEISPDGLPETVRADLTVHPDGWVEHVFFETPLTNAALTSALRKLRFTPAGQPVSGRLDIRFVQEESR